MAIALYRPVLWFLILALVAVYVWMARSLQLRWWPALVLRLAFAALVVLALISPRGGLVQGNILEKQIMLLDLSESIPGDLLSEAQQRALQWTSQGENRVLIAFGRRATPMLSEEPIWPQIDGLATDLQGALDLASVLLRDDPGEIVLVSDGMMDRSTGPDRLTNPLKPDSQRIDVIPLPTQNDERDAYLGPIQAPSILWVDSPFTAIVPVSTAVEAELHVEFEINGTVVLDSDELFPAGTSYVSVTGRTSDVQIMRLSARLTSEADPRSANNTSYATARVFPAPRILILSEDPEFGDVLLGTLQANWPDVSMIHPDELPADMLSLGGYQVVFVHNLLSSSIDASQAQVLKDLVTMNGSGLVFLGGMNSYTLGAYQDTILEPLMPVKLEPPPRQQREPMTFVLVLDQSTSMAGGKSEIQDLSAIDLEREAALRAIEMLGPEDILGVLGYSDRARWVVPIRPVGESLGLREAQDAVSRLRILGGTKMLNALRTAIRDLTVTDVADGASILLLSDGVSSDGDPESFRSIVEQARQQGITVSTIALGTDAEEEIMRAIAEWGNGRFFDVDEASDLPAIMVAETQAARGENVQEEDTSIIAGEQSHPVLSGLSVAELPLLHGYNALASRAEEGAEDILLSANFEDPLLSAWQVGLGRVIAWMGDLGEKWSSEWIGDPVMIPFWSQVARYALPNPASGPVQSMISLEDGQLNLAVEIRDARGQPQNMISVTFTYLDDHDDAHSFDVPQAGPGSYSIVIPSPPPGAYRAAVAYQGEDLQGEISSPFAVNYPDELRPGDPETGRARLLLLADESGGQVRTFEDLSPLSEVKTERQSADGEAWLLLAALVVLWPLEIAVRRGWLPWQSN